MSKHGDLWELLGGIAFFALLVVLGWLYLKVTPDQFDGEHDWAAAQTAALAD